MEALDSLHLGNQIVFKTDKAIKHLKVLERLYLSAPEKVDAKIAKIKAVNDGVNRATSAYQSHPREGQSVFEVFQK